MRSLAEVLDVVPMALYKHVANKDELLGGMIDVVLGEAGPVAGGPDWKRVVRERILAARAALLRHPWASRVMETRGSPTSVTLDYTESMIGAFRAGGFSADLTHHVMHALGSRVYGFSRDLFDESASVEPEVAAAMMAQFAAAYPNIVAVASAARHDSESVVGAGCDDQFEFEFALDLMLDGFERLRDQGWTSAGRPG